MHTGLHIPPPSSLLPGGIVRSRERFGCLHWRRFENLIDLSLYLVSEICWKWPIDYTCAVLPLDVT